MTEPDWAERGAYETLKAMGGGGVDDMKTIRFALRAAYRRGYIEGLARAEELCVATGAGWNIAVNIEHAIRREREGA